MIAAVIFIIAHLALLVGITTPEKFYFDEVHYVPAARQMLEPVMPSADAQPDASAAGQAVDRLVDPHFRGCAAGLALPGRAVRIAGDRRDVSLRPRAVRRARPRDRDGLARLLQPDGVRAIADRDAGYICAGVRPAGDRGVHARLSPSTAASLVRARRPRLRSLDRLQMERPVRARRLHRDRRRDPPDAKLAHAVRRWLMPATGTGPELWPDFRYYSFRRDASC